MATVTNWVEHLTTDVDSSTEGILVLIGFVLWSGWHVIQSMQENDKMSSLARKGHGPNAHKSNITDW